MIGGGIFGLVALALWVYCIFDCIRTDESTVQNLPKTIWLIIVIFVPTIGSIAWLLLGRPQGAGFQFGQPNASRTPPPPPPPTGFTEPPVAKDPDDYRRRREEALRKYEAERAARESELEQREMDLLRREEELRRREQGDAPA